LLLVIVRVLNGKHALRRGVFLSLFVFIHVSLCLFCVIVLFVMSLTQRKLLNSLITLGTMLSLSVGVRIGFVLAKKFQIFRFLSSSSS
jgi:hypothetical protein